jgi:hypothetical protein
MVPGRPGPVKSFRRETRPSIGFAEMTVVAAWVIRFDTGGAL